MTILHDFGNFNYLSSCNLFSLIIISILRSIQFFETILSILCSSLLFFTLLCSSQQFLRYLTPPPSLDSKHYLMIFLPNCGYLAYFPSLFTCLQVYICSVFLFRPGAESAPCSWLDPEQRRQRNQVTNQHMIEINHKVCFIQG